MLYQSIGKYKAEPRRFSDPNAQQQAQANPLLGNPSSLARMVALVKPKQKSESEVIGNYVANSPIGRNIGGIVANTVPETFLDVAPSPSVQARNDLGYSMPTETRRELPPPAPAQLQPSGEMIMQAKLENLLNVLTGRQAQHDLSRYSSKPKRRRLLGGI